MYKNIFMVISTIISIILLILVEVVFKLTYWPKSIIKMILFIFIPIIYIILFKDNYKDSFKFRFKDIKLPLILGLVLYLIIVLGYFILRNFIDFSGVLDSLTNNMGVNKYNFIYVSLYICIINSFLEELFFRNYLFINNKNNKLFRYLFSSLTFAIYHIGIMNGWFNPFLILIAILGLAIAGIFFNYIDSKSNTIYPSWIIHFFANAGINTIGFILFGLL